MISVFFDIVGNYSRYENVIFVNGFWAGVCSALLLSIVVAVIFWIKSK